jgi:hypothetical protein
VSVVKGRKFCVCDSAKWAPGYLHELRDDAGMPFLIEDAYDHFKLHSFRTEPSGTRNPHSSFRLGEVVLEVEKAFA